MKKIKVLSLMVWFFLAVGCASVVSLVTEGGIDQEITFTSEPSGAQIFVQDKMIGETPLTAKIKRKKGMVVVAKKDGFEDQNIHLKSRFNYWFLGNFITGGLLGSTTDIASHSTVEYSPDKYFVTMTQTNASLEDKRRERATIKARNFIILSYDQIGQELAREGGEYLAGLYSLLGIENEMAQKRSLRTLRKLYQESESIPEFAQTVLETFNHENRFLIL